MQLSLHFRKGMVQAEGKAQLGNHCTWKKLGLLQVKNMAQHREPHLLSDPPAAGKGLIIQFLKWGHRQTLHGRFCLSCPGGGEILVVSPESFSVCSKSSCHQDRKIPEKLLFLRLNTAYFLRGETFRRKKKISKMNFNFWNVTFLLRTRAKTKFSFFKALLMLTFPAPASVGWSLEARACL